MKQRILQVITSLLLIITLTMANILLLCVDFVSYATDVMSISKSTDHKNVEFMAYFKDDEGNKITGKSVLINQEIEKLYFQVSVKKEGYLNGSISLNDANFVLKPDVLSNSINSIQDNVIYLNQINAGETKEIEVNIEILKDNEFDLSLINFESQISFNAIYRDSSEKNISVKADRTVNLKLVSPYTAETENILLSQKVITNKILKVNGEDKRVIQVEIESGISDNLFPVKISKINVKAPEISDTKPESVLVNATNTLSTNGLELTESNWNYDIDTNTIAIEIENAEVNGKVSWLKEGKDNIIITYIFDKDIEINSAKSEINSEIKLYDLRNTEMNARSSITFSSREKDEIIRSNIVQSEDEIFKGKLQEGISRDITYKNVININLNNVADKIDVVENKQTLGTENLKSVYKMTKISKASIEKILGDSGNLQIVNNEDESVIANININTMADDDGNIVVTYPDNVETIKFEITYPSEIGRLEIESTKTISSTDRKTVKEQNEIISISSVSYISKDVKNELETTESKINLKETETSADLQISRTELSAMTPNDNVEFRVSLNSKNENNELYKNPVIKITLPEKIEKIDINSVNLIYEDELQIKSTELKGNTIEVTLIGEQTNYKKEAIDGAILIINTNLTTSTRIPSSTEQVELEYTNEKAVNYKDEGVVTKNIDIVSYVGVVTTNQVLEYGIDVVNNEGRNLGNLTILDKEKNAKIEKKIINNNENKISNVRILGTFPTKGATDSNNIETAVGNTTVSGIDENRVKIYYSNNVQANNDLENAENAWTENMSDSKNVKKYLIIIDELDLLEEVNVEYQVTIPANLEYNEVAEEGYIVYYNNLTAQEVINTNNIRMATPKGTIVETTLKALVAGKESNIVRENGILRYEIKVSNVGSEDVSNVFVRAQVPEGTTYVNSNTLNNQEDENEIPFKDETKKNVDINISNLASGEEATEYYEVIVNEGMVGKEISNIVETQYGEIVKKSNEVKTTVEEGKLGLQLISIDDENGVLNSGYQYSFVLNITNESNQDFKNIEVIIDNSGKLEISEIYYIDSNNESVLVKNTNKIGISKIKAGESLEIAIASMVPAFKETTEQNVSISARLISEDKEYSSNEINLVAVSNLALDLSVSSENAGEYVKAGDTVKYKAIIKNKGIEAARIVNFKNWISNDVTLTKVVRNGEELAQEKYSLDVDTSVNKKVLKIKEDVIPAGESVEYEIEVVPNLLYGNTKAIELLSEYAVEVQSYKLENAKLTHILQAEEQENQKQTNNQNVENNENTENNEQGNTSSNVEENQVKANNIISGTAWIDQDENGQKDMNENAAQGIKVKLLDTETNKFAKDANGNELSTSTSETGFYSFGNVENGQYIVIFEYDTTKYGLTTFEKENVSNNENSNVITKSINVNGETQKVAATEIITVNDKNFANINIGLINAKKYDLQLDKYISKVTVQNNTTETKAYLDAKLAKHELDAKQVNSTILVVEYTIKVTNKGDVSAYVKKIADYLSSDYKFNSELNKDWYQSGNDVYCTGLANEEIKPGEAREVTLTVIKEMTENNTGLINNTAEIVSSYNELGLTDINSTEGNKVKDENDMSSADLIISIKTGQVVMTVSLIFVTMIVLGIAILLLRRIILHKRLF